MEQVQYAITNITKEVAEDIFEEGESDRRTCLMDEDVNITGKSLAEVIAKLGKIYGLEFAQACIDQQDGLIDRFEVTLLEDADGFEPSPAKLALWRKGKIKLYSANYLFAVEKRVVQPLTREDFKMSGVRIDH